jgi:cell division protein FtsL
MEVLPSAAMAVGGAYGLGSAGVKRPSSAAGIAFRPHNLRGESGKANLKAVVWTAILVAFVYVSAMTLPVFISEYEFQDSLQDIARYASVNRRNNDQIRQAVLDEAQKDNLPIQADSVKVEGSGGNVKINVDYTVTVDLKFYEWTLDFHPNASNAPL